MKKIIAAFVVMFNLSAQAADVIAVYEFGFRDYLSDDHSFDEPGKVLKVTLDDAGKVELSSTVASINGLYESVVVGSKLINKYNLESLKSLVSQLSGAEIDEQTSQFVCEIFVSLEMMTNHLHVSKAYNYNSNSFSPELKTVDGPKGCWVVQHISPKQDYQKTNAQQLKTSLRVLGLELLK